MQATYNTNQTRRSFIASAAGVAAGTAAMGIATSAFAAEKSETSAALDEQWDEEYDVVIVGSGMAGVSAAVTVATEGQGATCLLANKMEGLSGNTPFSDGSVLYGHDVDAFYAYMQELRGEEGNTPDDVLKVYSERACELQEWIFDDLGANIDEARNTEPKTADDPSGNSAAEYPELEHSWACGKIRVGGSKDVEVTGPKHVYDFFKSLVEANTDTITFRENAALTELITDQTGRVTGAVIGDRRIHAKSGVIMCCGGFESNADMMQNFLGAGSAVPGAGIGNTGDGFKICARLGADFWHMDHVAGFWQIGRDLANTVSTNKPTGSGTKAYGITVGVNGRRYYMDFDSFHTTDKDEEVYGSDLRLNVGSRHGHMQLGGEWPHAIQPSKAWFIFDADGLAAGAIDPDYSSDPVADGLVQTADTIEELADMIGVPAEELSKTVEQWNECCENGEDVYFHRPVSTLTPVVTAPFYAQLCAPAFLNTDGGPVRDAKGEILDTDGNPIPGLYSAGEFGSIWSASYNGGGNLSEAIVFGRISVESALGIE